MTGWQAARSGLTALRRGLAFAVAGLAVALVIAAFGLGWIAWKIERKQGC